MNDKYIINRLQAAGMTLAGALGTWANIWLESGGNPKNVEDRSGIPDDLYVQMVDGGGYDFAQDNRKHYGFGLAQWTESSRKSKLLSFAKKRGCSIGDLDMQIDFLVKEMREDFHHVWVFCCSDNTPEAVANYVCRYYEIPANTEARAAERAEYARKYALTYNAEPVEKKETYWPPRTVDKSMTGPDVMALQAILSARGYSIRSISGIFDDCTDTAFRRFQADKGLAVDGVCGPLSWAALLERR